MTVEYSEKFPDRPLCKVCKKNLAKRRGDKFRNKCSTCESGMSRFDRGYTKHKKDYCENKECTAIITSKKQLIVHHADSNHQNNDPSNLLTICRNCDALITDKNRDYLNIKYRGNVGI